MRKTWLGAASIVSLAAGLAAPVLYFLGLFSEARFKLVLLLASVGWLALATLWSAARTKQH